MARVSRSLLLLCSSLLFCRGLFHHCSLFGCPCGKEAHSSIVVTSACECNCMLSVLDVSHVGLEVEDVPVR